MIHDPTLGYIHNKNIQSRHIERTLYYPIFDVIYSFDQYHRRVCPVVFNQEKHRKALVLFGCSFTYGNALNDNQTIHHYLNKISKKTYAYNYAIAASGTNMLLETILKNNFKEQIDIKTNDADLVYVYISAHIGRANGFVTESQWTDITPKFEWVKKQLTNVGSIRKAEPVRQAFFDFVRWLYQFFGVNGNFPPIRDVHLEYICDLVVESREQWKKIYPKGNLYFYVHPLVEKVPSDLKTCLSSNHVPIILGHAAEELNYDKKTVRHDGHPNEVLNREIAKELLGHIEKTK